MVTITTIYQNQCLFWSVDGSNCIDFKWNIHLWRVNDTTGVLLLEVGKWHHSSCIHQIQWLSLSSHSHWKFGMIINLSWGWITLWKPWKIWYCVHYVHVYRSLLKQKSTKFIWHRLGSWQPIHELGIMNFRGYLSLSTNDQHRNKMKKKHFKFYNNTLTCSNTITYIYAV